MESTPPDTGSPKAASPVMDVAPPRADSPKLPPPDLASVDDAPRKAAKPAAVSKPPKVAHAAGTGVTVAVAATVIIVLGLGVLMVYAYLRTNGMTAL